MSVSLQLMIKILDICAMTSNLKRAVVTGKSKTGVGESRSKENQLLI